MTRWHPRAEMAAIIAANSLLVR